MVRLPPAAGAPPRPPVPPPRPAVTAPAPALQFGGPAGGDPLAGFDLPPLGEVPAPQAAPTLPAAEFAPTPTAKASAPGVVGPKLDPHTLYGVGPTPVVPATLSPDEFAPTPTAGAGPKYDPGTLFGMPAPQVPAPTAAPGLAPRGPGARGTITGVAPSPPIPTPTLAPPAPEPTAGEEFGPTGTAAVPRNLSAVRGFTPPTRGTRDAIPRPQDRRPDRPGIDLAGMDLLAPRESIPRPDDLLAPRESIPRPDDLLAPRESVPRPDDLLASRESIPRPDDLLAPRESVPRPDDLLASRESIPRPDDFLASREAVPRPDDFLAPREAVPRPDDLLTPKSTDPLPENLMAPREAYPRPAPPAPPSSAPRPPPIPASARPPAVPAPPSRAPARTPGQPSGQPSDLGLDLFGADAPSATSTPLQALDFGAPIAAPRPAASAPGGHPDLGFVLEIEDDGSSQGPVDSAAAGSVAPAALGLTLGVGTGFGDAAVPLLAPLTSTARGPVRAAPMARPRPRLLLIAGGTLGALALATAGLLAYKILTKKEPTAAQVVEPMAAQIAADNHAAYARAADLLVQAAGDRETAGALRAAACEQWLLSVLGRGGERAQVAKAEQLLTAVPTEEPPPEARRARALLAIAKNKAAEVTVALGPEVDTPPGQLVIGLRDLAAHNADGAVKAFRAFSAANPGRVLAQYLIARALEAKSPAEAAKAYQEVLGRSPGHFGAMVGAARLEADTTKRIESLRALADKKGVPPGELSRLYVALGRAAQTLGQSASAMEALGNAIRLDPGSAAANLAFGEAYMAEGRYGEALQRLRSLGPAAQKTTEARFGLGTALVATGRVAEGLALVQQAARESPTDPRGLFGSGLAAEVSSPVDLEAAAQNYRAALKLDAKFLPATLKLAALLQRQGRGADSLAVLREAEEAGAPATALRLAWGEALVVAKEPVRAEEVFRKAIVATPQLVPAHLGLAAALDAQGKLQDAKDVLSRALAEIPDGAGLRERLGSLDVRLGNKDEAMDVYKAEIATGKASSSVRVAMAKLALELGRLEEAQSELDKLIDQSPDASEALFTRARLWEARGDVGRALQDYRRGQRFENTPTLNLHFARALLRAGREAEATTTMELALELPEGRLDRGRFLFKKGEWEQALKDFQEAAKLVPKEGWPHLWAGKCHDQLGKTDLAVEAWKTAARLDPGSGETHFNLGRVALDRGQAKLALEHLRKVSGRVTDGDPWAREFFFQLGTAEKTAGNNSTAITAFKKFLELAPADDPARPDIERQIRYMGGK